MKKLMIAVVFLATEKKIRCVSQRIFFFITIGLGRCDRGIPSEGKWFPR